MDASFCCSFKFWFGLVTLACQQGRFQTFLGGGRGNGKDEWIRKREWLLSWCLLFNWFCQKWVGNTFPLLKPPLAANFNFEYILATHIAYFVWKQQQHMYLCTSYNIWQKRFYTKGTLTSVRIHWLAKIPTLYRDWLRSLK